jgi:hypothetical protein
MSFEAVAIDILKWVRVSVRPVVVILALSTLALFLPQTWLCTIGIGDWLQKYRALIILLFAGSVIWLVTFPIEHWYKSYKARKCLQNLASDQARALVPFVQNNKATHAFGLLLLPAGRHLCTLGILSELNASDAYGNRCFAINAKTLAYLRKRPELVGLPKEVSN